MAIVQLARMFSNLIAHTAACKQVSNDYVVDHKADLHAHKLPSEHP